MNGIILFDSIHYVLAAERVLKERKVWCDLVPTPRELSSDCGMAVEFRACDLDAVRAVLADRRVNAQAVYMSVEGGRKVIEI